LSVYPTLAVLFMKMVAASALFTGSTESSDENNIIVLKVIATSLRYGLLRHLLILLLVHRPPR